MIYVCRGSSAGHSPLSDCVDQTSDDTLQSSATDNQTQRRQQHEHPARAHNNLAMPSPITDSSSCSPRVAASSSHHTSPTRYSSVNAGQTYHATDLSAMTSSSATGYPVCGGAAGGDSLLQSMQAAASMYSRSFYAGFTGGYGRFGYE